jgi:hypothetical protein
MYLCGLVRAASSKPRPLTPSTRLRSCLSRFALPSKRSPTPYSSSSWQELYCSNRPLQTTAWRWKAQLHQITWESFPVPTTYRPIWKPWLRDALTRVEKERFDGVILSYLQSSLQYKQAGGFNSVISLLKKTRPGDLESPGSCCELAPGSL